VLNIIFYGIFRRLNCSNPVNVDFPCSGFVINGWFGEKRDFDSVDMDALRYHLRVEGEDGALALRVNNETVPFEVVPVEKARELLSSSILFMIRGTIPVTLTKLQGAGF